MGGMRSMNALPFGEQAVEHEDDLVEEIATEPLEIVGSSAGRQVLAHKPVAAQRQVSTGLLNIWIILYGFVGTQLAWTLRPFFGDPDQGFQVFRHIEGNFYVNIVKTLLHLFK